MALTPLSVERGVCHSKIPFAPTRPGVRTVWIGACTSIQIASGVMENSGTAVMENSGTIEEMESNRRTSQVPRAVRGWTFSRRARWR